MSQVLSITKTQQKILEIFFLKQHFEEGKALGLTNYELGKHKIIRKTFDINKNSLISNGLLKLGQKRETGKRIGQYFELTPLGFFVLFQSKPIDTIKKVERSRYYLPFFMEKQDAVKNIPKDILDFIIVETVNSIELCPMNRAIKSISKLPAYYRLRAILKIPTVNEGFKISTEFILTLKKFRKSKYRKQDNEIIFDDYFDLGFYLLRKFTELFFYNLIFLPHNKMLLSKISRVRKFSNRVSMLARKNQTIEKTEAEYLVRIKKEIETISTKIKKSLEKDIEIKKLLKEIKNEIISKKLILGKTYSVLQF